jgi:predicted Zn-dependent peptidase
MRALAAVLLASALALQAQPRVLEFTLQNGLRVLHLEDHEHPMVRARLHVDLQADDAPPGCQGLPLLFQLMFDHGETADLKPGELDRMLEDSGILLSQTLGAEGYDWRLEARSRDQDRAMGLLADRLLRTLLDPSLLAARRLACRQQVEELDRSPQRRLRLALTQDPAIRPTPDSLNALTLPQLQAFRARVLRPDRAILVLHGDLGPEQAKRLVLLSLGTWKAQELPGLGGAPGRPQAPPPPAPPGPLLVPAPGSGLRIGVAALRPGGLPPEAAALLALLLPGEASLGPVQLAIQDRWLMATLDAEAGVSAALLRSRLLGALEGLRHRGFTASDLDGARNAWFARRSLDSLHPEAQMDWALAGALGRGATEERMRALSLDALNAALRSWLDPAGFRLGASGDPEDLKTLATP